MYDYKAQVVHIVDGDTIDCVVDLGFNITTKERFRFIGVNTPNRFTDEGKLATEAVRNMIADKEVVLEVRGKCKWGRWLAIVYIDGVNLNRWLIDNEYGVPYMDTTGVI